MREMRDRTRSPWESVASPDFFDSMTSTLGTLALARVPDGGFGDQLAVLVAGDNLEHRDGRQLAALLEALAVAREQALVGHLGEQGFKGDAVVALDGEVTRDLALAGLGARGLEKRENVVPGRQLPGAAAGCFRSAGHRAGDPYSAASLALAFGFGLVDLDLGLASAAAALPAFAVLATFSALGLALRRLDFDGPLAARSAISSTASSMVSAAGSLARGSVALTSPCLT